MTSPRGLRIGLVCPYSFDTPGGVQNHVLGLATYLRDQGHEPHILAPGTLPSPGGGAPARSARPGSERSDPARLDPARFTSAGSAVPVPYNGSVARINFGPRTAARVRRWLRHGDFDLLHIHEPVTPSISMLALWAAGVPVVATYHTATPGSRTMHVAGSVLRSAIDKIDAGIAVSESARRVVVRHLGRDAVVVPNGIWFEDFQQRSRVQGRWRGGPRPRLAFLGRVNERRKGLDVLLAAADTIRAQQPDIDIVIAGQGARALPPGVRSLGTVSDEERVELLAATDVFVAPHLERESFGIVLLEAMASGARVVASDLPAFVDLLTDPSGSPVAGLGATFPRGDTRALAAEVHRVLRSPEPGRVAAARRASRRYDWSVVGASVAEVYQAALTGGERSLTAHTVREVSAASTTLK